MAVVERLVEMGFNVIKDGGIIYAEREEIIPDYWDDDVVYRAKDVVEITYLSAGYLVKVWKYYGESHNEDLIESWSAYVPDIYKVDLEDVVVKLVGDD